MSGVAFVLVGLIEHLQARGGEGLGELARDGVLNAHLHAHHYIHATSINGGFTIASIGVATQGPDHA
jgi:hypothetical protein